jgi:hypothetical protein
MEKEFIPYTLALALKELGFDEPCFGYYNSNGKFKTKQDEYELYLICNSKWISPSCSAPTYQQAFRWFREKYGLYSWIQLHNGYINDSFYPELPITFSIMDRKTGNKYYERDIPHNYLYKTNEEAETACLEKLIEIVEQK